MTGTIYQQQNQSYTAYALQSAKGTLASTTGAKVLPQTGGARSKLTKANVESATVRSDAMSLRGKHGTRATGSAYSSELFVGAFDTILPAIMRTSWGSADLAITQSTMTSVTTPTANTIVATAGSWIAAGLRVGQVFRATGLHASANNGINLRITALTALTITTAETLVVDAVASTTFSITRKGRVLINPTTPVRQYFTLEDFDIDIDASELFSDMMWGSIKFAMAPDGNVTVDTTLVGTGQMQTLTGVAAPYFTSPSVITDVPMAAAGATIRFEGSDLLDLTSFDLTLDIAPAATKVIQPPSNPVSPDVFPGTMAISMNLTVLRTDLGPLTDFMAENQLSLHAFMIHEGAAPADFLSIYVPNLTLGDVAKSALAKAGGAATVTLQVPTALVGIDNRGGAFDPTMVTVQTSTSS